MRKSEGNVSMNLLYHCFGYFGIFALFAMRGIVSPSLISVIHIVGMCANLQVCRIHTSGGIAFVEYVKAIGDRTVMKLIRKPVNIHACAIDV